MFRTLHKWQSGDELKHEWLDGPRAALEGDYKHSKHFSRIVFVRLSEVVGIQSSSAFANRTGVVSFYNPDSGDMEEQYEAEVVTEVFYDLPFDTDDLVPCLWSAGKLLPLTNRTVRHFITVDSGGSYPNISQCPNTYPIKFVRISYTEEAGHQTPTIEYLDAGSEPDDYVHNLFGGDDSYIPEGTVGWCYSVTQQWFTYMAWTANSCSSTSSSSQSQVSSSSSSSKSSSSSSSKSSSSSSSTSSSSKSSSSSSTSASSSSSSTSKSSSSSSKSQSSSSSSNSSSSSSTSSTSSVSNDNSSSASGSISDGCDSAFPESIADIDNYNAGATQVLGHSGPCLVWIDVEACA